MSLVILFVFVSSLLCLGIPVAIAFFSGSFGVILLFQGPESAYHLLITFFERMRILFTMDSWMSIPLFIFMSFFFQRTLIAQRLLLSLNYIFSHLPGGIAISTILCGAVWGATTGLVGPSVVGLGVIAYPLMKKQGYPSAFSLGIVASAGSLGQIIPPSVSLIIMADLMQISTNEIFRIAFFPSFVLLIAYLGFVGWMAFFYRDLIPPLNENLEHIRNHEEIHSSSRIKDFLFGVLPPVVLICLVLGSLFLSIAGAKEAATLGAVGIIVLGIAYRRATFKIFKESLLESVRITGMIIGIVMSGVFFSATFEMLGGFAIMNSILDSIQNPLVLLIIFSLSCVVLGFFMDLVEISYVVIPLILPFFIRYDISPLVLGLILGLCVQISYLSPPFGYSLFYIKGTVPSSIKTTEIYQGVIPYLMIQILVLMSILFFSDSYLFLNELVFS